MQLRSEPRPSDSPEPRNSDLGDYLHLLTRVMLSQRTIFKVLGLELDEIRDVPPPLRDICIPFAVFRPEHLETWPKWFGHAHLQQFVGRPVTFEENGSRNTGIIREFTIGCLTSANHKGQLVIHEKEVFFVWIERDRVPGRMLGTGGTKYFPIEVIDWSSLIPI